MKWVIGIVLLLGVVCGGLCAAGGGYYYWMSRGVGDLALPDYTLEPDPNEASAVGIDAVGVESCDAYIEKMTACLSTMDATTKAATEASFVQTADAWRAAATTPEGKAGLEMGCKAALDAIPATCSGGAAPTGTDTTAVPPEAGVGGTETAPGDAKQGDSITPAGGSGPAGSGATPTGSQPATAAKSGSTPPTASSPAATTTASKPTTTTPPATTKAGTSTTPPATTKPSTSTPPATTKAGTSTTPPATSTTGKPSSSRPPASDDEPIATPATGGDSKVAIGFVLPSGGKWDELVVGVDGSSLGKRPLRTRVTPGSHTFTFKADGIDLSCPIDVGSSGRTIILDQKKKSCPSKSG